MFSGDDYKYSHYVMSTGQTKPNPAIMGLPS